MIQGTRQSINQNENTDSGNGLPLAWRNEVRFVIQWILIWHSPILVSTGLLYDLDMVAIKHVWTEVPEDNPIPLLTRRKITGEQILVARVHLAGGCHIDLHQHESEQMAIILSGRVRWTIGADGDPNQYQVEMQGGEVLELRSNVWHGVDVLEDTDVIDVLSPPMAMGVDTQEGR